MLEQRAIAAYWLAPDADAARRLADAFHAARVPAAVGYSNGSTRP